MDSLIKLNQDFNNSLDSGFSLTKTFKKGGLTNKIVNMVLFASLTMGAFKSFANEMHNQYSPTQETTQEIVVDNNVSANSEFSLNNFLRDQVINLFENPKTFDSNDIIDIVKNEKTSVYKMQDSNELLVIAYKNNIDTGNPTNDKILTKFLESENYFKMGSPFSYSDINEDDNASNDVNYINLVNNFYSEIREDFAEKHPTLAKYQNEIIMAHELIHASANQKEIREKVNNNLSEDDYSYQKYNHKLYAETDSDISSILVVAKAKDLSFDETIKIFEELSEFRKFELENYNDIDHATHYGINAFVKTLKDNPILFESLKLQDMDNITKFTSEYSKIAFNQLNSMEVPQAKIIRSKEIYQDIKDRFENPEDFDITKTSVGQYGLKNINTNYEKVLKEMSEVYGETGNARKSKSSGGDLLYSLVTLTRYAVGKRDFIKDVELQQDELNNFANSFQLKDINNMKYNEALASLKEEIKEETNIDSAKLRQKDSNRLSL